MSVAKALDAVPFNAWLVLGVAGVGVYLYSKLPSAGQVAAGAGDALLNVSGSRNYADAQNAVLSKQLGRDVDVFASPLDRIYKILNFNEGEK